MWDGNGTFQLIVAAFSGLIFAYWSSGLVYMLLFLLCYECLVVISGKEVDIVQRMAVVSVSILAWVLGRWLVWYDQPEDNKQTKRHRQK